MNKSSLILILKKLDSREFREFGELVHSSFFNKNQSAIKLYDYLKKHYPVFAPETVAKEYVYTKIFHKADYNDGFMRSVIFNLAALAEEYLKQVSLKRNTAQGSILLLGELNRRKLEKILVKNFSQAEKQIEALKDSGSNYYYYKYVYEDLVNSYANWSRYKSKNLSGYADKGMANENNYLTNFFLIRTLTIYALFLTKGENISFEFNTGFLDDAVRYILKNENEFAGTPAVMLYVNAIMLLKHKTDNYYYKLKESLSLPEGITTDQKYNIHNLLQTYCVHKGYSGETGFRKERFELYKLALEKNFYRATQDIYFDDLQFPNIVRTAISLGEYRWAEEFINKYKDELSPDNKHIVAGYVTGHLLFAKGEFEKALKVLTGIKSVRHIQYKVIIRNLMLMVYYELSYFDQSENLLASYRQYLSRNEKYFAARRFERLSDFIKYYSALLKIKFKPDENELAGIIVGLGKNNNVLEREWLSEKAKEMEKS
jgi:hypothetical protein